MDTRRERGRTLDVGSLIRPDADCGAEAVALEGDTSVEPRCEASQRPGHDGHRAQGDVLLPPLLRRRVMEHRPQVEVIVPDAAHAYHVPHAAYHVPHATYHTLHMHTTLPMHTALSDTSSSARVCQDLPCIASHVLAHVKVAQCADILSGAQPCLPRRRACMHRHLPFG